MEVFYVKACRLSKSGLKKVARRFLLNGVYGFVSKFLQLGVRLDRFDQGLCCCNTRLTKRMIIV